jgi:aldehyde dehydrogenase (NAD+)
VKTYGNFIENNWVDAVGGEHIGVRDPSTGKEFARLARGGRDDVDLAVRAAREALAGEWGRLTATERGRILSRISAAVLRNIDLLTGLETKDVGKPLTQARADVVALARYFRILWRPPPTKVHGDTIPYQNGFHRPDHL